MLRSLDYARKTGAALSPAAKGSASRMAIGSPGWRAANATYLSDWPKIDAGCASCPSWKRPAPGKSATRGGFDLSAGPRADRQQQQQIRRLPQAARREALDRAIDQEETAKVQTWLDAEIEQRRRLREQLARDRREQRERQPGQEQAILHADEMPEPVTPAAPLSIWGLGEDELAVLLEELMVW